MSNLSLAFLLLTLVCVCLQAYFTMMEMALVSVNKIRLYYFVSKKNIKATWISYLLSKPSRLFGTTLLCITIVEQVGSELSREFYSSLSIDPDFAPLTQVLIVLIFGELAPLFAARRHSESVSYGGVSLLYVLSKIFYPIIYLIDQFTHKINRLLGKEIEEGFFLSREELQKAFEETGDKKISEKEKINQALSNIFSLKQKKLKEIMIPMSNNRTLSSIATVKEVDQLLKKHFSSFIPLYNTDQQNIVSVLYPADLIGKNCAERAIAYGKSPWFIMEDLPLVFVLNQFRYNKQSVGVLVNQKGSPLGFITFDRLLEEIFGSSSGLYLPQEEIVHVDQTVLMTMTIEEFNEHFSAHLPYPPKQTLEELLYEKLKHEPIEGDIMYLYPYEFIVLDKEGMEKGKIHIRTMI
jgi:CBS domain containing-hemolysin-like protein